MLFLVDKTTNTIGAVFAVVVIVAAFGIAIWQVLKMKKEKRLAEEHKKQLKAEKLAKKNKGK